MMRQAWRRDRKRCLFRHAFRFRESKLSTRPSCMGFPSVMSREATFRSFDHFRIALRQCRSVFPDQKAAIASRSGDAIKFVGNTMIANLCVHDGGQTFLTEVMNHIRHTEPLPVLHR